MAACTHEVDTADTGNTPNTSGAFTPVLGDLLIVFIVASATVTDPASSALTSSVGMTFTQFLRAQCAAGVDSIYGFVSDALVTNAASQTVSFAPADPANGTNIIVCAVAGMTRVGLAAVRQSAKQDNQAAGTPAPAFAAAALTGNPTLGCIGNASSPAGLTFPASWTEGADIGYSTPPTGAEYIFRNSGFTGTTITWGGASATAFGSIIVELDSSAIGSPYYAYNQMMGA
jgi:hypothetical protein